MRNQTKIFQTSFYLLYKFFKVFNKFSSFRRAFGQTFIDSGMVISIKINSFAQINFKKKDSRGSGDYNST